MDTDIFIAHVTGEPFALTDFFTAPDAAGPRTNGSRNAAEHGAVALTRAPLKIKSLHDALKPFSDRDAFDVHILSDLEVLSAKFIAHAQVRNIFGADLTNEIHRRHVCLAENAQLCLV